MVKAKKRPGRSVVFDGSLVTVRLTAQLTAKVGQAREELERRGLASGQSDALRWIVATWVKP